MSRHTLNLTPELNDYLIEVSLRDSDVQRRLREETAKMPRSGMQISPEQGQFMALLARLIGAKRCIEIGTFTGYSALCVALALPADGRMICCDINEETTKIAKRYWKEAGIADKIDLRIGPGVKTLDTLLAANEAGRFDFAFIDADKEAYADYYERLLKLLRPGGLILVDNVLWGGAVADASDKDSSTLALRAFNLELHNDPRIDLSMLPVGDGVTLARKR